MEISSSVPQPLCAEFKDFESARARDALCEMDPDRETAGAVF